MPRGTGVAACSSPEVAAFSPNDASASGVTAAFSPNAASASDVTAAFNAAASTALAHPTTTLVANSSRTVCLCRLVRHEILRRQRTVPRL